MLDWRWKLTQERNERWRARQSKADFNEDEHPRDEHGRWTSGGGGSGSEEAPATPDKPGGYRAHPGEGYSKDAYVDKHGVIQTKDVYDAQLALFQNKRVNLDQPRKVSILIQKLGEKAKELKDKGEKAPTFNLCNVTVTGTNLFCADTKGIPRVEMPQLTEQQTIDFQKYLKGKGYEVSAEKQFASYLRATQNELNGAKVAGVAGYIRSQGGKVKPIIVSKDDYVLDGHHAWAGKLALDAEDGKLDNDLKMDVSRVNISITDLLHEADLFTGGKGHKPVNE